MMSGILEFEIIGKLNNQFLIYKNNRGNFTVSVYDEEMKQVANEKLDFLPNRVLSTDILAYRNFFYLFYQYQKRNVVYCMAAKMDADGKLMGDVRELDTTLINVFMNNKVYSLLYSEDKQKIAFIKINTKEQNFNQVTALIFQRRFAVAEKIGHEYQHAGTQ